MWEVPRSGKRDWQIVEIKDGGCTSRSWRVGFSVKEPDKQLGAVEDSREEKNNTKVFSSLSGAYS